MRALILVDLQNDFVPGGALPVPDGHAVIPLANRLARSLELVVATQDWHPLGHKSFAASHPGRKPGEVIDLNGLEQVLWPVHCVAGTPGAELVAGLDSRKIDEVFRKGTDPEIDSYSGFFDNGHRRATGLHEYLRAKGVTDVYILGLATDYCVKFTALDARRLMPRLQVTVVLDATRPVGPRTGREAEEEMRRAGIRLLRSSELSAELSARR